MSKHIIKRVHGKPDEDQWWAVLTPAQDEEVCITSHEGAARRVVGGLDALAACTPERIEALGTLIERYEELGTEWQPDCARLSRDLLTDLRVAVSAIGVVSGGEGGDPHYNPDTEGLTDCPHCGRKAVVSEDGVRCRCGYSETAVYPECENQYKGSVMRFPDGRTVDKRRWIHTETFGGDPRKSAAAGGAGGEGDGGEGVAGL